MTNITIKQDGLNIQKKVAVLKLEFLNDEIPENELFALGILLGGYNMFGRNKLTVLQYQIYRKEFSELLSDIADKLKYNQ
jgi:hypothetical protein